MGVDELHVEVDPAGLPMLADFGEEGGEEPEDKGLVGEEAGDTCAALGSSNCRRRQYTAGAGWWMFPRWLGFTAPVVGPHRHPSPRPPRRDILDRLLTPFPFPLADFDWPCCRVEYLGFYQHVGVMR